MLSTLKAHWPEYVIEAALLGAFMLSASVFCSLIEFPSSPVRQAIEDPLARRALMGVAMGLSAIALIYSPLGKRSGAHFNPAVTLTFLHLGKIRREDALFYVAFQFAGAVAGMAIAAALLRPYIADPAVNYVVTVPGRAGAAMAFAAELAISFALMTVVLRTSSSPRWERVTGLFAGTLVALYILFESPISGMSMNPARTFGSAYSARNWMSLWVYFIAPCLGMLLAAEVHRRMAGSVHCAKLHHANEKRCIFCGANA